MKILSDSLKRTLCFFLLTVLLSGCGTMGPASLKNDRDRYNQVVSCTGSEQMLMNLVKLKYRDSPSFLQVSSISTNRQWATTAGINAPLGDSIYSAGNLVPLSAGTSYTENPTVTYTPLMGESFVKQMLSPIPIETLILLFQAGWPVDTVIRLVVQEVNDLENASPASGPTPQREPVFRQFLEAAFIFRDLQKRRVIEWGIGNQNGKRGTMYIRKDISPDEKRSVDRVKALLKISYGEGNPEVYHLNYGICFTDARTLNVVTRSMTDILFYVSQAVQVPNIHKEMKLVTITRKPDGTPFDWGQLHREQIVIHSSREKPTDTYVAVWYRDHWFYLKDNDLASKSTFLLLEILGDLQAGNSPSAAPVLTLPVSR